MISWLDVLYKNKNSLEILMTSEAAAKSVVTGAVVLLGM
jgi:hypothetical protein